MQSHAFLYLFFSTVRPLQNFSKCNRACIQNVRRLDQALQLAIPNYLLLTLPVAMTAQSKMHTKFARSSNRFGYLRSELIRWFEEEQLSVSV